MILFVLRFYGPVNPMGSCRARSVYRIGVCAVIRLNMVFVCVCLC